MAAFWIGLIGLAVDFAVVWLIWRAKGRPLPAKLEWMRVHPVTRWLVSLIEKPVLAGF